MKMVISLASMVFVYAMACLSAVFGFHFCIEEVIAIATAVPALSYLVPWLQTKGFFLKKSSCPCGHDDSGAHGH